MRIPAVFFWLMVGHAIADYLLQSLAVNHDKNPNKAPAMWVYAMSAHCLANAGAVALATGSVPLGVAEFVVHFVIDLARCDGREPGGRSGAPHRLQAALGGAGMSARRTWADLERQAINDPLISAAVMMVRVGEMSREDALIAATLGLAEVNRQLVEENIKLRDRGAV
jgi:hypothetical protein